ncbi:MAG: PAS domain S-box protein [Candidatus Methanoperedens sp.]|uniref:hybrid sensor histidine kinase/response regulator n=1 Tax=Candidatus Methanoperedens sp. BLZ2 TaxID=2035255 RepID=UPI000BE255F9|nr:PAS domain S-box protein [Candidatus Methanoperedens sp. BLZ2]KAB2945152.1 MAG: PAS domain S-box protein [Candidatus Methanoperedens sp.]MBZ0173651.1 PAS domain S-box protein [Candidatus Methanoperedens nitroreducens]MCX9077362.1 PAS domain S-box protein [Candidatus Methanoperedens sp.]
MKKNKTKEELLHENQELEIRLEEAEETLRAIRSGEVDALVVSTEQGDRVYTLKGAEQPYRILIEEMKEGAVTLAEDDTILYCNMGFARMLKSALEKMIGTGISQFVSPVDRLVFDELLRQGKKGGSKGEVTFLAGDGTIVPAHISINAMQLNGVSTVYLVATDITELKTAKEALQKAHDELEIKVGERTAELVNANEELKAEMTEREQAEEALRESEQLWATTLASIGDAVISTDVEGRITFMNAVAEALTGWTLAEASTKPITDVFNIINEYTRKKVDNPVTRVLLEGNIVGLANHTILVRKDGTEVPIDDSGAPIRDGGGKIMGVVLVFRDITERKQAEESLQEAHRNYSGLFNNKTVGLAYCKTIFDEHNRAVDYTVLDINETYTVLTCIQRKDIVGKRITEAVPGISQDLIDQHNRVAVTGEDIHFETYDPATDRWYDVNVYRPQPGYFISVFYNITARKRAEEALRRAHDELELRVQERTAQLKEANKALAEREASYRELTESINDLFYAMDRDLKYTYWNKASEVLTGISAKDAIGKSLYEIFPGLKGTKVEQFYIKSLKKQRPGRLESGFQVGDKNYIFEINIYPTKTGLSVIAKDITETKMLEAQLLRAQRMESIGTLAGGIAHDLNNVLTPIMLSLQLLKEKNKDEQGQKLLTILEQNCQRGANLIKQVLSFARGVEGERNPLQAKHVIAEIEKVAKETFPRNIEIQTNIEKDLFTISGDATQLHQVIMNLSVNARDIMPDGGVLSITASNFFIDENYARMHKEAKVGSYVIISVSDTGSGVPPRIVDRIFEPFFTTKEFGKGTGLGLSTALAIVRSHGGFINVYSEIGKGTTFKIYLPAVKTDIQKEEEEEQLKLYIGHGELILVAEDEGSIREITSSTLETYGYKVLISSDGAEAVALYAQNKDKVKVVLMDMMMPVMDGYTSIRAIHKINPEVKIIAVSGLAEKDKIAKIGTSNAKAFLSKPYTAEKLLKTIHEIISTE